MRRVDDRRNACGSTPHRTAGFPGFAWLGPIIGPLGTAAMVVALVIFMLLERRDLRDRLIGLIGHGRLTVTTKAFDEAGSRVSKQLLMQSLVNGIYGVVAGLGLYFLGVPYRWCGARSARRFASFRISVPCSAATRWRAPWPPAVRRRSTS